MRLQDRPKDSYGKPIQTGCLYSINFSDGKGHPKIVRVYYTAQNMLMAEDVAKSPGECFRFYSVAHLKGYSWSQVDQDGVIIEPPRDYDFPSVEDKLSEIEGRVLTLRAELQRLELLACQALGCRAGDGSAAYELVFGMIYNCSVGADEIAEQHRRKFVSCGGGR